MKRVVILVFLALLLTGCAKTNSFQGQIEQVDESSFVIDCSDEVNKGKRVANSIGYGCSVGFTTQTAYSDENGNSLTANDFSPGSTVKVILSEPANIKKYVEKQQPSALYAKEIVLLTREEVSSKEVIISAIEKQGLSVKDKTKSGKLLTVRSIEPYVYSINGDELLIYQFPSEEEMAKGWSEFPRVDVGPLKNYDIDSFLIIFIYGKDLETETGTKIQHAIDELSKY